MLFLGNVYYFVNNVKPKKVKVPSSSNFSLMFLSRLNFNIIHKSLICSNNIPLPVSCDVGQQIKRNMAMNK